MATPANEKQKLVVAILVPNSKEGLLPIQIQDEYLGMVGQPLMPNLQETREFLRTLVDIGAILEKNGYYFANTENSKHVIDLVKGQNDGKRNQRNFNHFNNGASRGRFSNHNNQSSFSRPIPHRRQSICYKNPYIDEVPKPQPVAAGRIQRRRMTMGAQFRPDTPPRSRSRSNSPKRNGTFGRNYTDNEKRSHSPDLRKRPRDHPPSSPAAKRSRCNRSRSRSSSRDRKQSRPHTRSRSRSPPRDPRRRAVSRSHSPIESRRKRPSPTRERANNNGSVHENTPPIRPVQAVTPQDTNQRAIFERLGGVTPTAGPSKRVRFFKFNIIGDGLLFNVVHALDDTVALNPHLVSKDLSLATAIESVKAIITPKVHKKKCIILSIGSTDLRNGTCLSDMRKLFVSLYQLCKNNGLKPLVTTVSCLDTKELSAKADIFNEFLRTNFTNVIDLFKAVNGSNGGLADSLAKLGKGPIYGQKRATLSMGMRNRLVLRVDA